MADALLNLRDANDELEKYKWALKRKEDDFDLLVSKNYSNLLSLERFKEFMSVEKTNPNSYEYKKWLMESKLMYLNSLEYFGKWGFAETRFDRSTVDKTILDLIGSEIQKQTSFNEEENTQNANAKSDLTQGQIAMICYYIGQIVTRENEHQIAKNLGYKGKGSGVYQDYINNCTSDRMALDEYQTKSKNRNKKKLFKKVIEWLSQNNYQREANKAEEELNAIISKMDKHCN